MKRLACLALLLLAALPCAAGDFRTLDVEGLRITADTDWGPLASPGYVPLRFDITNLADARVVEIVVESFRYGRSMRGRGTRTEVRQPIRLARGDRVRITVPVPVLGDSENIRVEIQEGGRRLDMIGFTNVTSNQAPAAASTLVVAGRSSALGAVAAGLLRPMGTTTTITGGRVVTRGAASGASAPKQDFQLEPGRLPSNWLGYTSVRAVVIGPDEWIALDDAQRGALLTWTAAGGDLILAATDEAPLAGGGHLTPRLPPGGAPRAYFLGRIHRRPVDAIAGAGLNAVLSDAYGLQDADWGLPANRTPSWRVMDMRGFKLPIPGVNAVPTRAYLSILILFALLIGPANYWWLWRRKKQVLFVLTAPLISLFFIVLLAGYVVAGEGFHVSGRAATFTILDQARKQAVTRGSASLYAAGMTPGGGLRFSREAAVYALGPDGFGSRAATQVLELGEGQQYSSGIIQARAPTNVEEIGFRPARERLTFEHGAAGVRVVNGLGAAVQRLVYRSGGRIYSLDAPLADGASAALKAGGVDAASIVPGDLPLRPRFVQLLTAQPEGSYVAVLDRSPFWDPGVRRLVEGGSFHLLFGWPDGQP